MTEHGTKTTLSVIQANSMRDLVDKVNAINDTALQTDNAQCMILKSDIVKLIDRGGEYLLLYFK